MTPWDAGRQWRADAKMGFLGRKPARKGGTAQPLHTGVRIDLDAALRASGPALTLWRAQQATSAPLYSGGVIDCWPAWAVEVLQVAQAEMGHIKAFLSTEVSDG